MVSNTAFQFEALRLEKMASGHLCLNLSEQVTWEKFPKYAEHVLSMVGATKMEQTESVEMRIWDILVSGCVLRLVQEDFPSMVSLEAIDDDGDRVLEEIHEMLAEQRLVAD